MLENEEVVISDDMVDGPVVAELSSQRDENFATIQVFVAICVSVLIVCSMFYIGIVLIGNDGLVSYRPGDQALESQEVYSTLIDFEGVNLDGKGVTVCMVDSGIATNHPDMDPGKVSKWKDFVDNRNNPYDDNGHGTSMAGILVANGWMKGIAQKVEFIVAKALSGNGSGNEQDVADAIDWCVSSGADIISLSLGGAPDLLPFNIGSGRGSDEASSDAIDQGVIVIAAAGNDGGENDDGDVSSPCSERLVICVGGVQQNGEHWSGSSTGDNNGRLFPVLLPRADPHKKPELVAPAQSVPVINSEGTWSIVDGTSAATVYVTGAIALLLEQNPMLIDATSSANSEQIKEWIEQSVQPQEGQTSHDDNYGYGLLKIQALLDQAE